MPRHPEVGGVSGSTEDLGLANGLALTRTSNLGRVLAGIRSGVLDPLWSLSAEEQFYVVWPVFAALTLPFVTGQRVVPWILGVMIVIGPLCCLLFFAPSTDAGPPAVIRAPDQHVLAGVGMPGGTGARRPRTTGTLDRARGAGRDVVRTPRPAAPRSALPGWVEVRTRRRDRRATGCRRPRCDHRRQLRTSNTLPARLLAWPPLAWFGARASYSLYLWHLVVLALVEPVIDGVVGRAVALAAALVVGILRGLLVELPADHFRRRLHHRRAVPVATGRERTR